MIKSNSKKSQSLPLNTIVIAMLVIIVMLVIVVFFTSSIGKTGDQFDSTSPGSCSISNPVIKTMGYLYAEYATSSDGKACSHSAFEEISIVLNAGDDTTTPCGTKVVKGAVCCGTKTPNTWTCKD